MSNPFSSKKAIVIHSGGLDSSLCLALAMRDFGKEHVVSISFDYKERNFKEVTQAEKICREWKVDHILLEIPTLKEITTSALLNHEMEISHHPGDNANTLVVGRNGLMARLGAIYAHSRSAHCIYMGVIEVEAHGTGYRDCSRQYMDLKEKVLRLDLNDPTFEIRTPLVHMTKKETLELSDSLGILPFLLRETISCYEGVPHHGCGKCPTCGLRNAGIHAFLQDHPSFVLPY